MANTTTDVGRLVLQHPDLGSDGGSTLHTQVREAWTKLGDMIDSRYYEQDALANGASVDFEHNFKCDFAELKFFLFERVVATGELTRIVSGGTPDLDDFTIQATPGALTTQIRITNNTGSAQDIAIVIAQGNEFLSQLYDTNLSGIEDGQALVYDLATKKWVAGSSGDSSLKLQSIVGTNLNIKSGFIELWNGKEGYLASDLAYDLSGIGADGDYYLYVDRTLLPAVSTINGREVYALTSGMLVTSTTVYEDIQKSRYAYIGTFQRNAGTFENPQTGALRVSNLGGEPYSYVVAADANAGPNEHIWVNTTAAIRTITLPENPPFGSEVWLLDYAGTFGTNELRYQPSGTNTIDGVSGLHTYGVSYGYMKLKFNGNGDWRSIS